MYHAETAECNCEQYYGRAAVRDSLGKKQSNRSDATIRKVVARAGLREREPTCARASDEVEVEAASSVECWVPRGSGRIVNDGIAESTQFDRRMNICLESRIVVGENRSRRKRPAANASSS
jgi:hypothetical protein